MCFTGLSNAGNSYPTCGDYLKTTLQFKDTFISAVESVSVEIDYLFSESPEDSNWAPKQIEKFSTAITIKIPDDENKFWENLLMKNIAMIEIKDPAEKPFKCGSGFHVQADLFKGTKKVTIDFFCNEIRNGWGIIRPGKELYRITFSDNGKALFASYLKKTLERTVPKGGWKACDVNAEKDK